MTYGELLAELSGDVGREVVEVCLDEMLGASSVVCQHCGAVVGGVCLQVILAPKGRLVVCMDRDRCREGAAKRKAVKAEAEEKRRAAVVARLEAFAEAPDEAGAVDEE